MHLGDEGVIDKLMSIARSMVISNNAHYTRVSTRTCQLIIAIASNSEAIYPYHLISVIKCRKIITSCKLKFYKHSTTQILQTFLIFLFA